MKDRIHIDGEERHVRDVMNPPGMYSSDVRQREYSTTNDPLPMSGKLIPEFFGRRNIRDMFARKPSLQQSQSTIVASKDTEDFEAKPTTGQAVTNSLVLKASDLGQVFPVAEPARPTESPVAAGKKRSVTDALSTKTSKRSKSGSVATVSPAIGKGQQSLKGFFKPKTVPPTNKAGSIGDREAKGATENDGFSGSLDSSFQSAAEASDAATETQEQILSMSHSVNSSPRQASVQTLQIKGDPAATSPSSVRQSFTDTRDSVHDPVETKETWSRLFTKPMAPRCEGHGEPCITLLTKKPGMNLGRSFWMCPRPLGPSGAKEKNTQWRCQTFIWCSDWNSNSANCG